jgi:hypothetical protein
MVVIQFLLAVIAIIGGFLLYFVKSIFNDTQKIKDELKPIAPAIIEIQGKFTEAGHKILFPLTVTASSPLKLTEYGQKLIDESGFKTILKTDRNALVKRVKAKAPKTNYDIQQASITVIKELLDSGDDMLNPLKEYAFNNGLKVDILIPPAAIVLRDEVMTELKFG